MSLGELGCGVRGELGVRLIHHGRLPATSGLGNCDSPITVT